MDRTISLKELAEADRLRREARRDLPCTLGQVDEDGTTIGEIDCYCRRCQEYLDEIADMALATLDRKLNGGK